MTLRLSAIITADAQQAKTALAETATGARRAGEALEGMGNAGAQATPRIVPPLQQLPPLMNQTARSTDGAAGAVGNLVANFNDIGMMMAAGQNPLMLAVQQGTQITQVIGPMGATGAMRALGGALVALVSPINLVTLGVIAAGAAAVQWFTAAGDQTATLTDRVNELSAATDDMRELSVMTLDDIIEKYGRLDDRISRLIERQQRAAVSQAMIEARSVVADLGDEYGALLAGFAAIENQAAGFAAQIAAGGMEAAAARAEIETLWRDFDLAAESAGMTADNVRQLRDAMQAVNTAQGFEAQAAAMDQMLGLLDSLGLAGTAWYGEIVAAQTALEEARKTAAEIGMTDVASGIEAGATAAYSLATRLASAAGYAAELAKTGQSSGPDAARSLVQFGGGRFAPRVTGAGLPAPVVPSIASSPSGGAAAQEADAVQRLIDGYTRELDLLREADPVKREMMRVRDQMARATEPEREAVERLILTLQREKDIAESRREGEASINSYFMKVAQGANAAQTAVDMFLESVLKAVVQGEGPLAALFGTRGTSLGSLIFGGGGLFGGLFGGGRGTGTLGLPRFADGGMIYGFGGGRDDRMPVWKSPGEFTVNARATARNRALLEFINGGGDLGGLPGFADGGMLRGSAQPRVGGASVSMVNHFDLRGASDPAETERAAMRGMEAALKAYTLNALPGHVKRIQAEPMRVG